MSCLEFRRQMETAPGEASDDLRNHARECAACAEFGRRINAFDRTLNNAARIPRPENLDERILMRQSFGRSQPANRWRRFWPAVAAGLLIVVALTLFNGRALFQEAGLQTELVALVEAADYALAAPGPVAHGDVDAALEPVGLSVAEGLGIVSFAGRCLVRGNLSGHMVLRERSVPITVFLMPAEQVGRRSHFERSGWHGMLVPADHGTVGIVVPDGEDLDPDLIDRVIEAVRWQA